jgi:hypothetical protein
LAALASSFFGHPTRATRARRRVGAGPLLFVAS